MRIEHIRERMKPIVWLNEGLAELPKPSEMTQYQQDMVRALSCEQFLAAWYCARASTLLFRDVMRLYSRCIGIQRFEEVIPDEVERGEIVELLKTTPRTHAYLTFEGDNRDGFIVAMDEETLRECGSDLTE